MVGLPGQKFVKIFDPSVPLANSSMTSTPTAHCRWEDETARMRTSHQPSCVEAKKSR